MLKLCNREPSGPFLRASTLVDSEVRALTRKRAVFPPGKRRPRQDFSVLRYSRCETSSQRTTPKVLPLHSGRPSAYPERFFHGLEADVRREPMALCGRLRIRGIVETGKTRRGVSLLTELWCTGGAVGGLPRSKPRKMSPDG